MSDSKFDPGGAKFGNFINYYQFNPPGNRVSLLPQNFLQITELDQAESILCLDVGCNTGELTHAVYDHLTSSVDKCNKTQIIVMIGIDLDKILIERANESNVNPNIKYVCLDMMKGESEAVLNEYLRQYNKDKFDITFSFSITMWIHLNHGDNGLKWYLMDLCKYSKNVLIEPQPWKCYKSAVRRMKRCKSEQFTEFSELLIRDSVESEIFDYLTNKCDCIKLFETGETSWGRKMSIYKITS